MPAFALVAALAALHVGVARPLGAQEERDAEDVARQPNLIALFFGGTATENNIHLSVGGIVERQFNTRLGVGAYGDVVLGGDEREFFVAPAVFLYPAPSLR